MAFLAKDPVKEAAKAQTRQAADAERAVHQREENERKAAEAFKQTPQGQARTAKERGRTWFQVMEPISVTNQNTGAFVSSIAASNVGRTRGADHSGFLEAVESEGWKLEHVGYVFQPVSTVSRDKLLSSGQTETISGKIVGVYLFRGVDVPS